MKYAVEISSVAMIYIPLHKDWFRHSKLMGGIHRHTDSMETFIFFSKIRKVGQVLN
jgi:hypothetical protein